MWNAVRSAIDVGLQGQASRLVNLARDYKDRTIEEARNQAIAAGVTAALALFGLLFVAIGVSIGLIALYYAVATMHGPLAGFAAAGGAAMLIALLLFAAVAIRANKSPKPTSRPDLNAIKGEAKDAWRKTALAATSRGGSSSSEALALGKQTVDAAAGVVRNGSREAVLATLAATVIVGMLIGRRR